MKIQQGYLTEKSGSWLGHYALWVLDAATGIKKRRQKAEVLGDVASMTKTKAREALRKLIVKRLGVTEDSRVTLKWFLEQRWKPLREGTWRASTKATNEEIFKVITDRLGSEALEDVDSVMLQTWLNSIAKTRSGSAVKHIRIFLRSIFSEAVEQGYLEKNCGRLLKVPKLKTVKHPFLTMEQIAALLKASMPFGVRTRETCFLQLALGTALRPSEIFALRWGCVDLSKNTMTIRETVYRGKVRPFGKTTQEGELEVLGIPEIAAQALTELHANAQRNGPDDFVFPTGVGTFWLKENYLRRVLEPIAKRAGIPHLNYQMLRRTTATWAGQHGDLKSVQAIMRHKKAQVTADIYMQTLDAPVRDTSEKLAGAMFSKQ